MFILRILHKTVFTKRNTTSKPFRKKKQSDTAFCAYVGTVFFKGGGDFFRVGWVEEGRRGGEGRENFPNNEVYP